MQSTKTYFAEYSIIKEIERLINWSMEHLIIPSINKITSYSSRPLVKVSSSNPLS